MKNIYIISASSVKEMSLYGGFPPGKGRSVFTSKQQRKAQKLGSICPSKIYLLFICEFTSPKINKTNKNGRINDFLNFFPTLVFPFVFYFLLQICKVCVCACLTLARRKERSVFVLGRPGLSTSTSARGRRPQTAMGQSGTARCGSAS